MKLPALAVFASLVFFVSCKQNSKETLFALSENNGINFANNLKESKDFNVFNYRNFYNGGGVAIGDINNDGLPDVFFTGNQVSNKLYLNKGNFKFDDISEQAGFGEKKQWSTGVVMADVNGDGWLDIYVCNAGSLFDSTLRRNQLFINNHDLTFTEEAQKYGLDNDGYSTQASFFDYDMDGDLDCFIVNNTPIPVNTLNYANKRNLPAKDWNVAPFLRGGGDHLYRNDHGKFTEVTQEAGIHGSLISLGLGVTIGDINGDGYPDVYVSNDFFEKDYLYINQEDGTFKDELENCIQHTSLASMGADMQDINNDGYPDLFTTDMLPNDDYRLKTTSSFDNYDVYHLKEESGFYHQFMQNTIQLNNKNGEFMEIANYAGVEASDWSWGGLMFDANNDGYNDLYICNGIAHDLTNQDFIDFFASDIVQKMAITGKKDEVDAIINKMPSTPLKNKVYSNQGNLRFADVGDAWGFTQPSFSNGAAYGDLDNDGDLDLVVNNVNGPAFVYRNNSIEQNHNNYIAFLLKGKEGNNFAVGAKVEVYANGEIFSREEIPSRGFQSSMDYKIIIGLGKISKIDSVIVRWPDREVSAYSNLQPGKMHRLAEPGSANQFEKPVRTAAPLFTREEAIFDKHEENDYIDFYAQRNLPMLLSKEGPRAAVGDVNGDGKEDIYICGTNKKAGQLYLQNPSGRFIKKEERAFEQDTDHEEVVCLLFDCDGDGDLDLYVGSGGNNKNPKTAPLEHRLFKNDGKGNFTLSTNAFPANGSNIGAVVAADFDHDGDLDLFVGGRNMSYLYGVLPASYIFLNDGNGNFTDIAATKNPDISHIGMVTGAAWADVTGDEQKELIITGEWMSPKIYSWASDHFEKINTSLDSLSGWWQSIATEDLDGDGKQDLVLGNLGENAYLHPDFNDPVKLWINIFDLNPVPQSILSKTVNGKDMPVFLKHNLEDQFPFLKKQNLRHEVFAGKTVEELFGGEEMKKASVKLFNYCSSVIAWNRGNGNFVIEKLPPVIQFSCVNAIMCADVNGDQLPDIITGGNKFGFPPQFGRLDANFGTVMINEGNRKFRLLDPAVSGIQVMGEVRDIKKITTGSTNNILFLRNNDFPVLYKIRR